MQTAGLERTSNPTSSVSRSGDIGVGLLPVEWDGTVDVVEDETVDDEELRAAVEGAGYDVAA